MKIKLDTKELKNVMSLLTYVTPKKTITPMMGHIKIGCMTDNRVMFSAYDTDATMSLIVDASYDTVGSCTVNAFSLLELVKNLPSTPEVTIKLVDEQKIQVTQSRLKYSFNSYNPDEYPEFEDPNPDNFSVLTTDALCDAIEKVETCISADEYRPSLAGVHFEPTKEDGFMRAVASDGSKLMSCKFPGVIPSAFTVSKKGVTLMKKILSKVDECGIYVSENTAYFSFSGGLFSIRLLNKTFPDYKQIIPRGTSDVVVLSKEELANALRRSLLFVESKKAVDITVTKELFDIASLNAEGSGSESIPLEVTSDIKNPFTLSLSCEFLLAMIEKLSGENISLRYYGVNQPVIIHSDASTLGLLMPLRR